MARSKPMQAALTRDTFAGAIKLRCDDLDVTLTSLAAVAGLALRSSPTRQEDGPPPAAPNPLQLGAALQMAILFQLVLMVVHVARGFWGDAGVLGTAAVLGLTDVDALTVTMARGVATTGDVGVAALAIGIGILSNTAMKMVVALILGRGAFRRIAAGTLAAMLVAGGIALALFAARFA